MNSTNFSTNFKKQLSHSSSLIDAVDAVAKWKPTALLTSTAVTSIILATLFAAITESFIRQSGTLAGITAFIGFMSVLSITVLGLNATGIWLSDEVFNRSQRSIKDAIIASIFSSHRLLIVLLVEFLVFLAFILVLGLILLACKMPGVGPLLYAFAMPAGVIATGIFLFALIYMAAPLSAPAIWSGNSAMRTLIMLQAVARTHLIKAVVMMVLLGLMTLLVIGFVWIILGTGTLVVAALSAAVLNVTSGDYTSMAQFLNGGDISNYSSAIRFGAAVLVLAGANPGLLIALKGMAIIYREVSSGLALDSVEIDIKNRVAELKVRAEMARVKAMNQNMQTQPAEASTKSSKPTADAMCPGCHAPVSLEHAFCGECGHKLK